MYTSENTPEIKTSRLILRRFTTDDLKAFFDIMSDETVNIFLPWFTIKSMNEAKDFLFEKFLCYYEKQSAYKYAICLKEDNIPIGYATLSDDESNDFGYGLRRDFWHNGIATEASRAIIDCIKSAGLEYITATHDVNNAKSGAVMKRLGMNYCYSYNEQVQPKNIEVTFRLYQLNFGVDKNWVFMKYWNKSEQHFIEKL